MTHPQLQIQKIWRTIGFAFLIFVLFGPPHAEAKVKRKGLVLAPRAGTVSSEATLLFGKKISTIEMKGLKRIEKDAVLAKLISKSGQLLLRENVRNEIQALFALGYFGDIEILGEAQGDQVAITYSFSERPVISKIEFDGNERISSGDLHDVVKVKEWSILDVNKVKEDVALIQKHYEDKGFYLAKVSYEIEPVKPSAKADAGKGETERADEVHLTFKINDYEKVQIKKITFLNNRRFSDEQLKAVFQETKEGGFFSFMSSSGNFKESAFKIDLQRLTYWYLDHGFVKFRHENPVITVSDDKKWLYVSVYIDEGDSYRMGQIDFGGELLFSKEEMRSELLLREGEGFSISKRNLDIQHLTEKYQDLGYAFVNVIPKFNFHDDSKVVDIEYDFEKGNLVYFGEVTVLGNSKTHDKVIRRELKIHEGELYNGTRLRESRENVERLGYFAPGEVVFNTITPKGKPDILNVEITVKERSTGTITVGAGYGSANGFFLTGQVSEINLMGKGQTVSLAAQLAKDPKSKSFNLGFTDPYAFDSRWSMGFDTFFVTFPIPEKWTNRRLGGDIRLGYPVFDYTSLFITYKNEGSRPEDVVNQNSATVQSDLEQEEGTLSSLVWSLVRDRRNNRFETTGGNYQSVSLETAGVGGTKRFLKWSLNNRYYTRVVGDLVFRNSFEYGQIGGWGGKGVPPSERFYLGGPNNLKGFPFASLGPKRAAVDLKGNAFLEPEGGLVQMFGLFELEYPLFREAGLKWVMFYDIGNSFSQFPSGDDFKLRQDAGFGIRWFSPIGPLRFEWGFPLNRKPDDSEYEFSFFIGPPF